MKIAVCLPSLNEAANIASITHIVDQGLSEIILKYPYVNAEILNFDSNSIDQTPQIFQQTYTHALKQSFIVTNGLGKGRNILDFCEYVINNDIEYCLTIDSDIKSATPAWIVSLLTPLLSGYADYVTPVYKRSRFEGSSTNHFAVPFIFAITGQLIRQPIAGDFGFTKKIAKVFLQNKLLFDPIIEHYGIDIFMSISAINANARIEQINLDKKIHAPSFHKLEYMFPQIASTALLCKKQFNNPKSKIETTESIEINILENLEFLHKDEANKMKKNALSILKELKDYKWCSANLIENYLQSSALEIPSEVQMSTLWIDILQEWIIYYQEVSDINSIQKAGNELLPFFVLRAVNFWIWSESVSIVQIENAILEQAYQLRNILINKL